MSKYRIRLMLPCDMPEVLRLEAAAFPNPWRQEDIVAHDMQPRGQVWVASYMGQIVGHAAIFREPKRLIVLSMAVEPNIRRMGVGSSLLSHLKRKLTSKRPVLCLLCVDRNLAAHQFFRDQGLVCTEVHRQIYNECEDDGYMFEYRIPDVLDRICSGDVRTRFTGLSK